MNVAVRPASSPTRSDPAAVDHQVVVVGAGFGGMGIAIQLRRDGIEDFVILDREDGVGGTWHVNRYPGLAVDIASVTYSYSFAPNPSWSRVFAPGEELRAYANHIADDHDLRRHLRLSTNVTEVRWEEEGQRWHVDIDGRPGLTCRYLVMATGFLSHLKVPDIPGLHDFAGDVMHTARWDDDVEIDGRRVAIIGTGATSVQLVPELTARAAHLDVYQRTPIWCVPKVDGPIPRPLRTVFRRLPLVQRLARHANSGLLELLSLSVLFHRDAPALTAVAERLGRAHIRRQVRDPELRRKLTPTYEFGCKRPTFSNDYYPCFAEDHVDLVTDGIQRIDADGITTTDGVHHPADVLVLATGFRLMEEGNYPPFPVLGRDGRDLGTQWRTTRFTSYEGITVHGYPNLFYLPAPYTYSGLSYFFTVEAQMAHVSRVMGHLRRTATQVFEATAEAEGRYVEGMRRSAARSLFTSGDCGRANSYYFNEQGEAAIARLSPTPMAGVRARTFDLDDYRWTAPPPA